MRGISTSSVSTFRIERLDALAGDQRIVGHTDYLDIGAVVEDLVSICRTSEDRRRSAREFSCSCRHPRPSVDGAADQLVLIAERYRFSE